MTVVPPVTNAAPVPIDEARPPFFVGVDLGGQSIKIGVVDDLGRPLSFHRLATEPHRGPEAGSERIAQGVRQAIGQAGVEASQVVWVGLGSPGTMDVPAGTLIRPHNLPGWYDFPIRDRVSHHCGLPVAFANDANAAAYGEFWVGSGREMHSMVLFTLGTGIGCGVIIGELLIDGENSHGAECGHIIIDYHDDARMCGCGQTGHLEAYASAVAVVKRTQEALDAGRPSSLGSRLARGETLSPLMLSQEAERGDELSRSIIEDTARYLGVGAVTLMHTVDPDGLVLGGAMTFGGHQTALGRQFLGWVRSEVSRRAFPVLAERIKLDFAALGGDAGFIGAAGVARLNYRRTRGEA